jgi:hypothetical protein
MRPAKRLDKLIHNFATMANVSNAQPNIIKITAKKCEGAVIDSVCIGALVGWCWCPTVNDGLIVSKDKSYLKPPHSDVWIPTVPIAIGTTQYLIIDKITK